MNEKLRLLPRKEFEIVLEDGKVIKGRFGLFASKLYSDKLGLTLLELYKKEEENRLTFDDVVQVLLCAVEYVCRKEKLPFNYTDMDVCEWYEWLGGIGSPEYMRLMEHSSNKIGEKKSLEENQSNGPTSSESVMQAV